MCELEWLHSRADSNERVVEEVLLSISRRVLKKANIDPERNFFDQGGDSLSLVHYVAAILREFTVGLTMEAVVEARTINEVKNLILEKIPGPGATIRNECDARFASLRRRLLPRQETVVGPVPIIANRYSYFLKRNRNLQRWNVASGALVVKHRLDADALGAAVDQLIVHHDALRLQLFTNGEGWRQVIVGPDAVEPLVTVTYRGAPEGQDFQQFVEATARDVQTGFTFPGELFKVIHLCCERTGTSLLFVISHHLLVDAYAFRLVLDDLFELYRCHRMHRTASLPPKTTSFLDYSMGSTKYWMLEEQEEVGYWQSLPWDYVERVPVDYELQADSNTEQYTINVVESLHIDKANLLTAFFEQCPHRFINVLLAAIATAYYCWTRHRVLHLATVFHGRESFLDVVDLTRTVGWISETIPLLLQPTMPLEELLADTRRQVDRASARGKSYGVLRFLAPDGTAGRLMNELPLPEVSLNIKLSELPWKGYSDMTEWAPRYRIEPENMDDTERVFLLSGGAYFRQERLCLSWDFSTKVFAESTVVRFTKLCMAELKRLIHVYVPSLDCE